MTMPPLMSLVPARNRSLRVVGVDPGETTGICVFNGCELLGSDQLTTKGLEEGIDALAKYLRTNKPDIVSIEDYRVYSWESDKHKWAALHTPKLIGAVYTICYLRDIPIKMRMAQAAKGFVTDEKLKAWGLYKKAKRHSRDAMRHAIYSLIFE